MKFEKKCLIFFNKTDFLRRLNYCIIVKRAQLECILHNNIYFNTLKHKLQKVQINKKNPYFIKSESIIFVSQLLKNNRNFNLLNV